MQTLPVRSSEVLFYCYLVFIRRILNSFGFGLFHQIKLFALD